MAGQERLGRQTPSEKQRLIRLGRQTTSEAARMPIIPSAMVRLKGETQTPSGMRRVPSTAPPVDTEGPPSSGFTEPAIHIDVDDDADTRLYRPRTDPTLLATAKRNSSGFMKRSGRPSNRPGIASRPGALILIPTDVPSVRVRADSDVDLIVTHPSGAPYETEPRRMPFSVKLLIMVVVVAVLVVVAHEITIALHLPWFDSKTLLGKLPSVRLLRLKL